MAWAGGHMGEGSACQGNILAGEEVVTEMARGFEAADGDLLDRLLAALLAGDRAGVVEVYDRDILIRHDPLLEATSDVVADLQRRLVAPGRLDGAPTGLLDARTRRALAGFAGEFNLEEKLREDDLLYGSLVREIRDVTLEVPEP